MSIFDRIVERYAGASVSFTEHEALGQLWAHGEDCYLREDLRFRKTPWGRWILSEAILANDTIYSDLHARERSAIALDEAVATVAGHFGRPATFCSGDPRFVLRNDQIRLSASELSDNPVVEDADPSDQFTTHLPLHTLKAAAASRPMGEWGKAARDQNVETIGWIPVNLHGRRLNERMFVAQVEGHSMDDGRSGLRDGGYAVFELWPAGSKQLLNVLVRGAFHDPETGSYAVKKYVADERDEEGQHSRVALVSLNPDKERYPDIVLDPQDDGEVAVVAKVVQALASDDFMRRPKPQRRAGRRALTGHEAMRNVGRNLAERLESFFDSTPSHSDEESGDGNELAAWSGRLVCLDPADGGVCLEVGPLGQIAPLVAKLCVVGTLRRSYLLPANARARPERVPVQPGDGPWRWEALYKNGAALSAEDATDLDLQLDALEVQAPAVDRVSVFRVDATGAGRLQSGTTLAPGQAYRLLLPPGIGLDSLGEAMQGGWRIWSIDLARTADPQTRSTIEALDLALGEPWPRLEWGLPARRWAVSPRGAEFPRFGGSDDVLVQVRGLDGEPDELAVLFLHGPGGTSKVELPHVANAAVGLGSLAVGRWACRLLHPRTDVRASTLYFDVSNAIDVAVPADCSVHVGDAALGRSDTRVFDFSQDTAATLSATAPPGWPVTLRWRVTGETVLGRCQAGEGGRVDFAQVVGPLRDHAGRAHLADVVLDFAELGRTVVRHKQTRKQDEIARQLAALWHERQGLVRRNLGSWLALQKSWFAPAIALLGYNTHELKEVAVASEHCNFGAWRLVVDKRSKGAIRHRNARLLVVTADVDATLAAESEALDDLCEELELREAVLVTDGQVWTSHRLGVRTKQQRWDLAALGDATQLEGLLAAFGENIE